MQDFYPALVKTFSTARLNAYHDSDGTPLNLDVVARYAHNMVVSQRLNPALHIFEVGLRNNVHQAFRTHFADPEWYDKPGLLGVKQQAQLAAGPIRTHSSTAGRARRRIALYTAQPTSPLGLRRKRCAAQCKDD
ncbi:hypothetical protein RA280_31545 [Cupriavidus sp. CV2]|uniref:hypothetical protein n=1 Tax=Cupriavidus ulmosensis TaxID=3065913 RepID=UPI00296B30A7|nr:hypothetical protein [Cupriavidus sp. CV2]MDW3686198.1 hypothetical protein [Cupriavidus sp. CV2]